MIGNNIGNPIGGVIPLGGTNTGQAVTANITWGASVEKAVGKSVTANYDWAVSVEKAVSFSVSVALAWAGIVTKNAGKAVGASFTWASALSKEAGKGVTASMTWLGFVRTLTQNIVDTTNLHKPINFILAGQQKYSEKRSEAYKFAPNYQREDKVPKSGVSRLTDAKPSYTTKTGKKGYD